MFERGGGGQDRCLKKLGSKFIRTLSVFNITKNDRVYIYIYFDLFLYRCLYPSRYFVDPHFAATSSGIPSEKRFLRRPSRSSSLFSRPGTFRGAHSSLSPSPPPFPLVSHASSTSSRYLLLVSRPRADLDATRLDPREKRRNESGTPLELLMLLRSRRIPPRLLNRLISAGKMNGSINTSFRADHPRVDEEALLLDRTLISRTFGRLKLVVPIYTLRGSPPPPTFLFLFLLDSIESFESKGVSPVDIYISPNYNRLK